MEIDLVGKTMENKQIIFKRYTNESVQETDMELKLGNPIKLEAPKGSNAVLVKNLYLSCDPYMRGRMRDFHRSYIPPFSPGSVRFLLLSFIFMLASCLIMVQHFIASRVVLCRPLQSGILIMSL